MRSRTLIMILSAFLAFGAVACDDTADGIETDTEQIGDEVQEGADEVEDELEDAGDEMEEEMEDDG